MAGDEIIDRLRAPAVRDLLDLDVSDARKPLDHHMLRRSESAPGAVAQAWLLLCQDRQFGEGVDPERGMRCQDDWLARQLDDWHQVLCRVDVRAVYVWIARHCVDRNQNGVAIGCALGCGLHTHVAIRTRPVCPLHLLTKRA